MDLTDHLTVLAGLGAATLIMAWLPSISRKLKVSYPIFLLLIGFALYYLGLPISWPDPFWPDTWLMYISEVIVIISLMGAGLKISRDFSWKKWRFPFQLILITMPLCMIAVFLLGYYFLGFSLPTAILLAAIMAPTDPVLAAEVQLPGPQGKDEHSPTKFALTAEAGMNDGLAFPFTFMAVMVATAGSWEAFDLTKWVWDKLLLKILIGLAVGFIIGRSIGYLLENLRDKTGINTRDGFLALSTTFLTYGLAELVHGYGFLAVFVAGLSIRHVEEIEGDFKKKMHNFIGEIERLLLVFWLVLMGGSIMNGLLSMTGWKGIVFALLLILVIRPLAGRLSSIGCDLPQREKWAVSFLGIRGIGSVFYLTWAFLQTDGFSDKQEIYAVTAYVILFSIIIHGLTAPNIIRKVD